MRFYSQRERRLWYTAGLCLFLIYLSAFVGRPISNALRDRNLLRLSVLALFVVAGIVIVAGILRSRPGRRVLTATGLVGLLYAVVLVAIPMVPEERLHFLEYGLVGALIYLALRERERQRALRPAPPGHWLTRYPPAVVAVVLTGLAGWLDEGIQGLLPDRYYDLRDVAFNTAAGLMAVIAVKAIESARAAE